MDKLVGKICYTINNKTKRIDTWRCSAYMGRINSEPMYELKDGPKVVILPKRCIYSTIREALKVVNKDKKAK
jgi:hypothetical protein